MWRCPASSVHVGGVQFVGAREGRTGAAEVGGPCEGSGAAGTAPGVVGFAARVARSGGGLMDGAREALAGGGVDGGGVEGASLTDATGTGVTDPVATERSGVAVRADLSATPPPATRSRAITATCTVRPDVPERPGDAGCGSEEIGCAVVPPSTGDVAPLGPPALAVPAKITGGVPPGFGRVTTASGAIWVEAAPTSSCRLSPPARPGRSSLGSRLAPRHLP